MSYVPSGTVYNSPSRYVPGMRDAGQDYVAKFINSSQDLHYSPGVSEIINVSRIFHNYAGLATYIASTGLVQSGYENGKTPQTFEIFDVIGKAGMYPISISGLGNATFDGLPTATINTAYGNTLFTNISGSNWISTNSSIVGGSGVSSINGITSAVTIVGTGTVNVSTVGSTIIVSGNPFPVANSGNVIGPASSISGTVAIYNNASGNVIADATLLVYNSSLGSFAEGFATVASGSQSHAEGNSSSALGAFSHAEGSNTQATGIASHAEGINTFAVGNNSHAENNNTFAIAASSHAEGQQTYASGIGAHAEGLGSVALGAYSHAEGEITLAAGNGSHAEGSQTKAYGIFSHAAGINTIASGQASMAIGNTTTATGVTSFAAGSLANANHAVSIVFNDGSVIANSSALGEFTLGMTGGVRFLSGTSLLTDVSGVNTVGAPAKPFQAGYFNNLFVSGVAVNPPILAGQIFGQVPTGAINSSNTSYTLTNAPISNSLQLYYNGALINPSGAGFGSSDYTLSGSTITTLFAPITGSSLSANYQYSATSGNGVFVGTSAPSGTTNTALVRWGNTQGSSVLDSNITSDGNNITLPSGGSILATVSGTDNIGSSGNPFNNIYVNNIFVSGSSIGQRIIANNQITSQSFVGFSGLTTSQRYQCKYNLTWNTTNGFLSVRFNNDTGNNYTYNLLAFNAGGTSNHFASATPNIQILTDNGTEQPNVGGGVIGEFEFQTQPGSPTKSFLRCSANWLNKSPGGQASSGGGNYSGTSNVTEVDLVASAGTFTGQVLLYALP